MRREKSKKREKFHLIQAKTFTTRKITERSIKKDILSETKIEKHFSTEVSLSQIIIIELKIVYWFYQPPLTVSSFWGGVLSTKMLTAKIAEY